MFKKSMLLVMALALTGVICGPGYAQDEVVVSDTQVWGSFGEGNFDSGVTLRIVAGGNLTLTARDGIDDDRHMIIEEGGVFTANARLDTNSGGRITMNGGEFYSNVDCKFPDNAGDQNVQIWLYSGTMVFDGAGIQSFADRGSTLYMGAGVFRAGNANGAGYTPGSPSWNIEVIPGYPMYTITDLGDAWVEVAGVAPFFAGKPSPGSGDTNVARDGVILTWTPGKFAQTHDVYFGETFESVDAATVPTYANLDVNTVALDRLEFGTTYFWRVDEANAAPDTTVFKGQVWSFRVEPKAVQVVPVGVTASSSQAGNGPEKTIDGSGLNLSTGQHSEDDEDMWVSDKDQDVTDGVSLTFEFEDLQKLHELHVWNANTSAEGILGFGFKDVIITYSEDGTNWTRLGGEEATVQFEKAGAGQVVPLVGAVAKFVKLTAVSNWSAYFDQRSLSEVQFSAIPVSARDPKPGSGAENVDPRTATLAWRAGREAGTHEVFVSADPDALGAATTVTTNSLGLGAMDLSLGTTYYWQVDEVNDATVPRTWPGDVWSFSTARSLLVEDFESYGNESPDRPFQTWIDGFGFTNPAPGNPGNNTGSGIGYDIWSVGSPYFGGDIMETQSTASGSAQAMPVYYDNSGANGKMTYSQVDYSMGGQDWTANGLQTLSIAFRGTAGNTGTLYAKINNTKIPYDLAATDIGVSAWQVWNIDLAEVTGSITNVQTLSIGIDGPSASGMILLDDIKLFAQPGDLITPAAPDNAALTAQYRFEGNANDSSGSGLHGTLTAGLAQVGSPGASGQGSGVQLQLGGYVDLGNPTALDFGTGDWTIAAWFKTDMTKGSGDDGKGTIVAKGGDNAGGHRYALTMNESTEGIMTLVLDDNSTKITVDSSTPTNDDQWHHVTAQRQVTEIRVFIDGQLEATDTADPSYDLSGTSQHNAYIGTITNNASGALIKMFDGSVDEVVMYGRALSAQEILWLAGRTTPIHKPF